MALGTIAPVPIDPHNQQGSPVAFGDLKMTVTNVTGDSAYPTGGSPVTPQQLGLSTVFAGQAEVYASTGANATSTAASLVVAAGGGSANLKCFTNANAEVANATNVSGVTWQIIAFGY